MTNNPASAPEQQNVSIAIRNIDGHAPQWWIVHKESEKGRNIASWPELKDALINRLEALNKEKVARDKLAK